MINFCHVAGRQSDLVAVTRIAVRRFADNLLLRQLALQRVSDRNCRIRGSRHTHRLIDIAAAGKRVPDRAAKACRRAAERLDFGGVVVSLVLEKDQPFLGHRAIPVVRLKRNDDRAGVVFFGLFHVRQYAVCLQLLHSHERHVHETDIFLRPVLVNFLESVEIALPGKLHRRPVIAIVKTHVFQFCCKGGVAAVIRPVGIEHADLGDGGIAVDFAVEVSAEIFTDEFEIRIGHRKAKRIIECPEIFFRHRPEAFHDFDICRNRMLNLQCRGLLHSGLSGINRVDAVSFDAGEFLITDFALQNVGDGGHDGRILALADELDALLRGIRSLIELPRKRLNAEGTRPFRNIDRLPVEDVDRRL